ncbi:hypothetical protein Q9L58_003070 [Maublancomyces gigas]|uniref:Uncharacterized protein n=1 Tax=Discina gigas TaxID=1032678 RepID=A0ABR3GPJ3_9PEZI
MSDEDQISFSSPPESENADTGFEGNVEQDYKKARDKSLPISERGDAFTRICEAAPYSGDRDTNIRKAALEHVIQLSPELGTEKSANFLTGFLFDPSSEIRTIILTNVSAFIEKTDDKNFEIIIYNVVEELGANRPSNEESEALENIAKNLMRSYSTQFFSALVAPSSVSKGSLRWLATNYPKFRSEILSDEAGAKADRALVAALKSASTQLTDTIDEAMLIMDAMNTAVRSVKSVLGIYSDLLRVPGESGVVIVSTALTSNMMNQRASGFQRDQPRTPDATDLSPKRPASARSRDSGPQISPKANLRRSSPEIQTPGTMSPASSRHHHTLEVGTGDDVAAVPYTPTPRVAPSAPAPAPAPTTQQSQRSSSAPPTPTPVKHTFSEPKEQATDDHKRARKESSSNTPSPTYGTQRHGNSPSQGESESYRGNGSRGRYMGKNYIPNYRGRGSHRVRDTHRPSHSWRGRQTQWSSRGERGEYQSNYRGTDYSPRTGYE